MATSFCIALELGHRLRKCCRGSGVRESERKSSSECSEINGGHRDEIFFRQKRGCLWFACLNIGEQ